MKKGFSIVELLIVIGIVSILTAMAIPRFKEFQKHKNTKTYYTLSNGEKISCQYHIQYHCGIELMNCKDGKQYVCQQGVKIEKY